MASRLRIFLFIVFTIDGFSQGLMEDKLLPTRQDTLRGSITPEREWWDLTYYHLDIKVEPDKKFISGSNTVGYKVLKSNKIMQIDLQEPMQITSVIANGKPLKFNRDGNAYFIELKSKQKKNDVNYLEIFYEGFPKEAIRAPWDGGLSWKKDDNGNHFIATSCQGLGASVWWPNKDHMYDEVDSMLISVNVPKHLTNVSNGRLRKVTENKNNTKTYDWFVTNPINNYGVNINIGDYVNFSEVYKGEKGDLDIDNYVLSYNLEKAKEQFKQVPMMIEAFEYWFGPYPFYEDSFKMVEVPYLGMEHQSAISYGNKFRLGYLGNTRFTAGLGFDFIIVHESAHEWWGNSITANDISDMWIQEAFCTYSEVLFVECIYGYDAMIEYVKNQMSMAQNRRAIVGTPDVHQKGSNDMYAKGSSFIHTLRSVIDNDNLWFDLFKSMTNYFKYQTVEGRDVLDYINEKSGRNFDKLYEQYLYTPKLPQFEYELCGWGKRKILKYRWNAIEGFDMPLKVTLEKDVFDWIYPESDWKELDLSIWKKDFQIANHLFMIDVKKLR